MKTMNMAARLAAGAALAAVLAGAPLSVQAADPAAQLREAVTAYNIGKYKKPERRYAGAGPDRPLL